jgi:rsbT co-antagonist protein RsbR
MANPKVTISGVDIEWDPEQNVNLWAGVPTLSMWVPTTVAGLMSGMVEMVGVDRFKLFLQLGGQQSVKGDWGVIASAPTFEQGFALMANIAWPAGWGRWEILSLDFERKEARYRVRNNWESIYQRELGVDWGSCMMAGKLAGITARLFDTPCWAEQTMFAATGAPHDEFTVRPNPRTVDDRLSDLLKEGRATSADLAAALQKLRFEVAERERAEQALRDKLALIEEQEVALRSLTAPILQVWEGVLAVPVMGTLDDQHASALTERLLRAVVEGDAQHVILDLTAVELVDPGTADHLIRVVRAAELLGAHVVVTGIRPAVSHTIVALGLDLGQITTLRSLQEGLKACMAREHGGPPGPQAPPRRRPPSGGNGRV